MLLLFRYMIYFLFFFQAEDGIRDLLRSRGLGDVYKRQAQGRPDDDARRTGAAFSLIRHAYFRPCGHEFSGACERCSGLVNIGPDGESRYDQYTDRHLPGHAREAAILAVCGPCLLYTSDAADDLLCVDLGGRRLLKKTQYTNTL